MAEFYKRQIGPEFADTSAAPKAALKAVSGVVDAIENFRKMRAADEKILRQTQYQNAATRAAVEAYQANPNNFEGYDREFTKNLRQIAPNVPLAETGTYGAIANRTRERYYWTISANQDAALKNSLKENYLGEFLNKKEAGFGLMNGQLLEPDQSAAIGENFAGAVAALGATAADGTPLFSEDETAAHVADLAFGALSANLDNDINPDMSMEAVSQLADPNFNYTVTIGTDGGDPLVFSKNSLPPGLQNKFTAESAKKLGAFLKKQNDLAAVDHFAAIYDGLESYTPGSDSDMAAGELYARVQIERTPFTEESIELHASNMRWYLQNCGFLPNVYAEKLAILCSSANPLEAIIGATLIDGAIAANPAAAKALDDGVVTRAFLIFSQIQGGTPADVAVSRTDKTLDRALNADRDAVARALKAKKSGTTGEAEAKFYGGDVTAEKYGYGGVEFFQRQVDENFLLNGGNRDLAVKKALAATNARYVKTKVGYYGAHRQRVVNAPESFYGPKCAPYVNQVLAEHRNEITKKTGLPYEVKRIKLVATPDTEWKIQTGERPEWLMLRINGDGSSDFYINRETGRPMTFSLPEDTGTETDKFFHTLPEMDPNIDDGSGAFFNLGIATAHAQLATANALWSGISKAATSGTESVGKFFKKIWSQKREVKDAR
jgi:hypothetical protein